MKYAIPFRLNNNFKEDLMKTEIVIVVDFKSLSDEEKLKYFIEQNQDKKIFIKLISNYDPNIFESHIHFFNDLYKDYQNFVVCGFISDLSLEKIKQDILYPYCNLTIAKNMKDIKEYLNLGVSEIYIQGDLLFNLEEIKALTKPYNIQIRYLLNMPDFSLKEEDNPILTAFIRPEDIKAYEEYIDTIEIYENYRNSFNTILDIYTDQNWYGDLSILVPWLPHINNKTILFNFASNRLNCKRKCLSGGKPHCKKCLCILALAEKLEKKELQFRDNEKN